jgi:hypothetical protein
LPLSERVRIEEYLPDVPREAYQELLSVFEQEFTYAFGGCTTIRGVEGNYLSQAGGIIRDRVNLLYTDVPLSLEEDGDRIARYVDRLREAAFDALDEEAILVAVFGLHHSG